ncbi:hypothetical protein HNR46_003733 [Haloferula luteola]|uniref:Secreted protein n=1 Tax=Haloferula luteola TaxID=595692 RepID=A0A840V679_9BACT|nr:hypothetical protein [Haloferula luteola]MBB5353472.1 hypothetical protein [Haloferula luteola]
MKLTRYLLSFVAALLAATAQAESPDSDPFAVDAKYSEPPSNPNHLEPLPAYDPDGYDQAVFRSLIGDDPGELWMIGKPSFCPEYAVIIRHEVVYAKSDDPFDRRIESEKWIVERAEAKKQIWQWKELEEGRSVLDIKVTKDVVRSRAEITKEFASQMFSAWQSVLQRTRYPDEDYRGLDGATFQFYCHYNLFGEVWTPQTGLPRMLTDLGFQLAEVATATDEDRPGAIAKSVEIANKISTENQKQ